MQSANRQQPAREEGRGPWPGRTARSPWSYALRNPPIATMLRTVDHRWQAALCTAIRDGVDGGDFDCLDPDATATRIGAGAGAHTGPSERYARLDDEAEAYAWLLDRFETTDGS